MWSTPEIERLVKKINPNHATSLSLLHVWGEIDGAPEGSINDQFGQR